MTWIFIAIGGYLLLAIESIATKLLLVSRVKSWQTYAFLVGVFSLFSLFFWPLTGGQYDQFFALAVLSGLVFFLSLLFLFQALEKTSASRVYSLYGAVSALAALIFSEYFFADKSGLFDWLGAILLILGGLVISFKFYRKELFAGFWKVVLGGVILAFSFILLKISYLHQDFWSGYVYSRLGIALGAFLFFAFPSCRKVILKGWHKKSRRKSAVNFVGVVLAKILAGTGTILINWAISLGSVAVVSSLVSVQFLFTFILGASLSFVFPKLDENVKRKNLFYKLVGIFLIIGGIILISLGVKDKN